MDGGGTQHLPVTSQIYGFFFNGVRNKKDERYEMRRRGRKGESVLGKRDNLPQKRNPDLVHNNYHPVETGIWTQDSKCGKPAG